MLISVTLYTGEIYEYKVPENSCVVGRSQKCEVVVPHEGVSRQHVRIEFEKGEFYATDLGSTNGLYIDGKRIPPHQRTLFKSYLPLVFGPVQTLVVKEEVETLTRVHNPLFKLPSGDTSPQTTGQPRPPKLKGPPIPKKEDPPPPPEGSEIKMIFITLLIALLVGFAWHWHKQMNQQSRPNETEQESAQDLPEN